MESILNRGTEIEIKNDEELQTVYNVFSIISNPSIHLIVNLYLRCFENQNKNVITMLYKPSRIFKMLYESKFE